MPSRLVHTFHESYSHYDLILLTLAAPINILPAQLVETEFRNRVSKRAYELFLCGGSYRASAEEDWLKAESIVKEEILTKYCVDLSSFPKKLTLNVLSKDFLPWAFLIALVAEDMLPRYSDVTQNLEAVFKEVNFASILGEPNYDSLEQAFWSTNELGSKNQSIRARAAETATQLGVPATPNEGVLKIGKRLADHNSNKLEKFGLLQDPDEITFGVFGMLALGAIGLVPTHFNIRTQKGERLLTEVSAKYWNYRKEHDLTTGIDDVKFHFDLIDAINTFIGTFKEAWAQARTKQKKKRQ